MGERKNTKIQEETLIMLGVIKGYLREPIYKTIHRLVEQELKRVEQERKENSAPARSVGNE